MPEHLDDKVVRPSGFTRAYSDLCKKYGMSVALVYGRILLKCGDRYSGSCTESLATMAKEIGINRNTVIKAINKLVEAGEITNTRVYAQPSIKKIARSTEIGQSLGQLEETQSIDLVTVQSIGRRAVQQIDPSTVHKKTIQTNTHTNVVVSLLKTNGLNGRILHDALVLKDEKRIEALMTYCEAKQPGNTDYKASAIRAELSGSPWELPKKKNDPKAYKGNSETTINTDELVECERCRKMTYHPGMDCRYH